MRFSSTGVFYGLEGWNGAHDPVDRCAPRHVGDRAFLGHFLGLPTSVKGGGHNIAGSAVCDGGLLIDLSRMRSVRVDPEERVAH